MTWVRLDEAFPEHPKIARLDDHALALFVFGLCYANRNLTDGFVPANVARGRVGWCERPATGEIEPRTPSEAVVQLERAGLWEPVDGGYSIHDFDQYQPSRASVLDERSKAAERQKRLRDRRRHDGSGGTGDGGSDEASEASSHGDRHDERPPVRHGNSHGGSPPSAVAVAVSEPGSKPGSKPQTLERRENRDARPRDAVFDAVAEWQGVPPGQSPPRALARTIGTAVADIRRSDPDHATPDEVRRRIANLPREWETPGPMALAAHWFALDHRTVGGAGSRLLRQGFEGVNRGNGTGPGPAGDPRRGLPPA